MNIHYGDGPFFENTRALFELSKVVIMSIPTKFQKIDSYASALCIGALASLSFWFLIIGSLLGIIFGPQEKPQVDPLHPAHYAQSETYDVGTSHGLPSLYANHTDTRFS